MAAKLDAPTTTAPNVNAIEFFLTVFIIDSLFYKGLLNKTCELKITFIITKLFSETDDKANYDLSNIE